MRSKICTIQCDCLQIALEDGAYAGGRVTVQPLPEQVHGQGNLRTFSMRRIEAVVSEADAESHMERELLKVLPAAFPSPPRICTHTFPIASGHDAAASQKAIHGNELRLEQTSAYSAMSPQCLGSEHICM